MVSSILFPPHHRFSRGTAACAVKKHGRYEFRFTLRGSSTHCPIKKLRLCGSRSSRTYCSTVRVFIIIIIIIIAVVVIFVAQTPRHRRAIFVSCYFERKNETNNKSRREKSAAASFRQGYEERSASIQEWTDENGTRWERTVRESAKKMKIRRML